MSKLETKTNNTPTLRFPEFSGEWEEKRLGELDIYVSDGNYGEMYPKANEMKKEGVPFIRANNIKGLKVVWDDMYFISTDLHNILQSGHLKAGDILVTTRGDIGMLAYVSDEFEGSNINAQICLLRVGKELSPKFLLNYLSSQIGKKQFKQLQTGSALKQLPKGNLAKIRVSSPTFLEQIKIASFLTSIDDWIENLKKQKEAQEKYKKGMMQKIFSQEIRFKDETGDEYPEWEEKRLGDYFNITSSKRVFQSEWKNEGVPFYRAREIVKLAENGFVNNSLFISETMFREYKQKYGAPEPGDLLITGVGTLGRVYLVKDKNPFYFKDGNIIWLRTQHTVDSFYVAILFELRAIKKQILDNASLSTVGTFTIETAKKLKISVPIIGEQSKIASFLSSLDDLINLSNQRITQAEKWKKGVMQRVFV